MSYLMMAVTFGPTAFLVGFAIWAKLHEPPATTYDDFLEDRDTWGRQ